MGFIKNSKKINNTKMKTQIFYSEPSVKKCFVVMRGLFL